MIHAYNEQFMPTIQEKLASMFELAVNVEKIDIDDFSKRFLSSRICHAFETADPVFVLGKSADELLAIVLDKEPESVETSNYASPEYWVGWVLAFSQWYLNRSYEELIGVYPCGELILEYFPYHEMDIMHSVELFSKRLPKKSTLKQLRKKRGLTQEQLALLSGISDRTIKSYEQGQTDISNAQADILFALSQVLVCTIEDLIK